MQKTSLGYAGGKPNPLNPPYQGDFPLNSPLIRGARGVKNDERWVSCTVSTLVATRGSAITISSSGGGDVVSYSIDPAIANGLSFDATSGTISGTPTATAPSRTYTITASNSAGTDTAMVNITVNAAPVVNNPAPTIATVLVNIGLAVNAQPHTLNVAANFSDPDDTLTFSVQSDNTATASVGVLGNMVTITPIAIGTTTITVTAADTIGQTVTQTFMVTVIRSPLPNPTVCMRHVKVQEVIIQNVDGKSACGDITAADLAAITVLVHFGGFDFAPPKRSDFAGLTALTSLVITDSNNFDGLTTLPADLLQGLPALRSFDLKNNKLPTLPIGILSGLSLDNLQLSGNPWVSLPTNILNEMTFFDNAVRAVIMNVGGTNAALPVANGTIPAQSLALTANPLTLEVATFFSDPDDTLTYTATSATPAIASVDISGSTLTITPVALGTTNIMVTARDTAGQPVTQTFVVTVGGDAAVVTDTTPPTITLLGSATLSIAFGTAYTDAGATASDNIDGNITASITTTITFNGNAVGAVNPNTAGVYTITYNVSDTAGNPATPVTRTVTVMPAVADTTPTAKATESVTVSEKTIEVGGSSITVESRTIQVEVTTGVGGATTITRFSAAEVSDEKLKTIANKAIATGGIDVRMESSIDSTITPTLVVNTAVDISVNAGACPAKGCEVTLSYEASDEQAGKDLYVFHYDGAQWEALPHVRRDTINRKVTALATRFSPFALFNVSRADKLAKQLNKDILPNLVQTMLASTMSAVSTRMDAAFSGRPQAASYQFDGQTVQLYQRPKDLTLCAFHGEFEVIQ